MQLRDSYIFLVRTRDEVASMCQKDLKKETNIPMLEKPAFPEQQIITCLQAAYGLSIVEIMFLPIGNNLDTAVYRAVAADQTPYFCKLRRGVFDKTSVVLPKLLSEQGITQIIAPIIANTGQLWAMLDEFNLILYPFIEGKSGYEVEFSERQWVDFGAALKRIHTTSLPPALAQNIQTELYASEWRGTCRSVVERLDNELFDDPLMIDLVAFLRPKREMILDQIGRAERLVRAVVARSAEKVLCHSDIHPGNLFIDTQGRLYIVDWDAPMLAPKERDLMFIGGGQGFMAASAQAEEQLFYRGYGPPQIDPIAFAYYRYARNTMDISVECMRILSSTVGDEDRAQSLQILKWYFSPGGTIEMAYESDQTQ
jgi:spectinomycin phosphotransferase